MWITAEMMTDLYNHDAYSRQIARDAILGTTTTSSGAIAPSKQQSTACLFGGDSDADRLRAELQSVTLRAGFL